MRQQARFINVGERTNVTGSARFKKLILEGEYEKASDRADEIFGAKPGTPEHKELQELLKALKKYEDDFVKMLKGFNS